MFIDLSRILSGRTNKQCFDAVVEVDENNDFSLQGIMQMGDILVKGDVYKSGDSIILECTYETKCKFQCGRCLCDVERIISGSLNKKVVKHEVSEEEEEMDYVTMKSEALEISELVLDEVILNLPLQVICSDDCRGICPSCGVNLNETPCDCDNDTIDPRLEDLKKFFNKD